MNSKTWGIVTTVAGAFLGGAGGYAATQLDTAVPHNGSQWTGLGLGAALGGVIAVGNLLMKSPLKFTGGEGDKS